MSVELDFLRAPRVSAAAVAELNELTEQKVLAPARRAGYELRLVGATVLPQRQTIEKTPWGTWLFVDHLEDPTATRETGNRIPIPESQLARLEALRNSGVRVRHAWIGHQLPDSYREGDALPPLIPPARHLREKDERLTHRLRTWWNWLAKAAGATLTFAAAAPAIAGGAVASLAVGLDPIIFGGVQHPEHPVVQWVVLAQWEWE
jgi:hypothetical protein